MFLTHRHPGAITGIVALLYLLLAGTALAQRVEGERPMAESLYAAEVPVRSQNEEERRGGFARALAQVLGKLSGDPDSSKRPGVSQELRRAERYVEGFDYRQDEQIGASGLPSYSTMLVVRFRQRDIAAIISALGLPSWPEPRPKPVLWLAIDDGRNGPRLVGLQQNNAVRTLLDRAIARGYRLGLPAGDDTDQTATDAIWTGDISAIARLSSRYSPPMQLIGKLYRQEQGWQADWILVDNGQILTRASKQHPDARQAMATGADIVADALVKRDARAAPRVQPTVQRVAFTGIHTSADYTRLSALLQQMPLVRGFRPLRVTPERLEAELDLVGGLDGFQRGLDETKLRAVNADGNIPAFQLH